jgi:hypothetical protein
VAEAIAWRYLELISQQSGLAGARRILICTMAPLAETAKSIYKHMSEFPEKALWKTHPAQFRDADVYIAPDQCHGV